MPQPMMSGWGGGGGWKGRGGRVVNRKGKWKTLQAGNSEPSNASTHDVRVGGGGGGRGEGGES